MAGLDEFGLLVKAHREKNKARIEDVATAIGRPTSFIWRIENGKNANPPSPDEFRKIAEAVGASPVELLESMGYLDAALEDRKGETSETAPGPVLAALKKIKIWDEWKANYVVDSVNNLIQLEERIKVAIAEVGKLNPGRITEVPNIHPDPDGWSDDK